MYIHIAQDRATDQHAAPVNLTFDPTTSRITCSLALDIVGTHMEHYLYKYNVNEALCCLPGIQVTPASLVGATTFIMTPDELSAASILAIAHALGVCVKELIAFDNPEPFLQGLADAEGWTNSLSSLHVDQEAVRAFRALKEWPAQQLP